MSGILALFRQDGAPVDPADLRAMAARLERRGPDGTGLWHAGPVGLGHTLLDTLPEGRDEPRPLVHAATGCVLTADVRLDNREDLLAALGGPTTTSDGGLILEAYLAWGEGAVERLRGDFAFVLWDPRVRRLLSARDPFGVRPLYYHHAPGRFIALASEPRALLALAEVPHRLNAGRIADFLISQLEGIDKTSTFFEEVFRLPPAHVLTVTPESARLQRYFTFQAGPELRLRSDGEYAEALLDVLTRSVRTRLRGGPVGSMLSGGMDSGSIVAVAARLLAEAGAGPLPTFSATSPDPSTCLETRTIQAAQTMPGLAPVSLHHGQLAELLPELDALTWDLDEPFDHYMTLPRVVYLLARRQGMKAVLDGIDGDTVLSEGSQIARLIRAGRWLTAWREAEGHGRFWKGAYPPARELLRAARQVLAPDAARRWRRWLRGLALQNPLIIRRFNPSLLSPSVARQVRLGERLATLEANRSARWFPRLGDERAEAVDHPYLTVGVERYGRVAAAIGIEPRHPFLDLRVVELGLSLPGDQRLRDGWPKAILRHALAGRLPDAVRWRLGKEHLGWTFTLAQIRASAVSLSGAIRENWVIIAPWVHDAVFEMTHQEHVRGLAPELLEPVLQVAHLGSWLRQNAGRRIGPEDRFGARGP
jgi:asparagine synthase (glutamine-hydrolysing)